MSPSVVLYIALAATLISVGAAVVAVVFTRRGADVDLRGDVHELSQFVERLAKDTRRERMRRVRAGEKVADEPLAPPELAAAPVGEIAPQNRKAALRARLRTLQGGR